MNITRLNFVESLPLVKSAISKSHFLAFDLQMSGIQTEQLTSPSIIDSIQKRYEKQKQSIEKFIPLQFGLSAFQVQPSLNKIIAHPFNFYIFPLTQPFETTKFSFHAGTMNFLVKNKFDFNKLFYEGIPYTSKQKLKIYEKQESINQFRAELRRLKQIQSPEVRAFIKMNLPNVEQWITSDSSTLQVNIAFIKYQSYMLLKEQIQASFQSIPLIFQFDNEEIYKRTKMTIKKCTLQQKQAAGNVVQPFPIESQALFNLIFDEMISSKKPLILHNGFLDLLHVYFQFVESLPETWTDYRHKVSNLFPYLYDNKYLFANSPILNHQIPSKLTGLENCFKAMRQVASKQESSSSNSVRIQISEELKEYNLNSLECHEAGFDSLMTGYSFLKGVTHLSTSTIQIDPNLDILVNPQGFHKEHELIRNRIPQGSIKVPFNFQSNDGDIYSKDGNSPIFFQSILNEKVQEHKIMEYFSRNYGSINLIWTARNLTQFCIMFISQEKKSKFLMDLKKQENNSSFICEIQNTVFLVLTDVQHQKKMNNLISLQKQEVISNQ